VGVWPLAIGRKQEASVATRRKNPMKDFILSKVSPATLHLRLL